MCVPGDSTYLTPFLFHQFYYYLLVTLLALSHTRAGEITNRLPTTNKRIPDPFASSSVAAGLFTAIFIGFNTILNPGLLSKLCNLFSPCPGYQSSRSSIFGFPTMYLDMFCYPPGFNSGTESGRFSGVLVLAYSSQFVKVQKGHQLVIKHRFYFKLNYINLHLS